MSSHRAESLGRPSCTEDDLYMILGCSMSSSKEQIVTEFRRLALECHPDRCPQDSSAGDRFKTIQRAYDILTDDRQRHLYDTWREGGGQTMGVSFEQFCRMSEASSFHWRHEPKQAQLCGSKADQTHDSTPGDVSHEHGRKQHPSSATNSSLRAFRNYDLNL